MSQMSAGVMSTSAQLMVDDLYNPTLHLVAQIVLALLALLYTLALPPTLYIVVSKSSRHMAVYKDLLVVQLVSCYVFSLVSALFYPIRFGVLKQYCFCGWLHLGPAVAKWMMELFADMRISVGSVQLWAIVYRVLCIFECTATRFLRSRLFVLSVVLGEMLWVSVILSSVCSIDKSFDYRAVQNATVAEVPAMRLLYARFPDTVGYFPTLTRGGEAVCMAVTRSLLTLPPIAVVLLTGTFVCRMRALRHTLLPVTYRMHKSLFIVVAVQMMFLITFQVIPNIRVFADLIPVPVGDCLANLQFAVDTVTILLGTRNYRRFLRRIWPRAKANPTVRSTSENRHSFVRRATVPAAIGLDALHFH